MFVTDVVQGLGTGGWGLVGGRYRGKRLANYYDQNKRTPINMKPLPSRTPA
jgi:hypothetical protein